MMVFDKLVAAVLGHRRVRRDRVVRNGVRRQRLTAAASDWRLKLRGRVRLFSADSKVAAVLLLEVIKR